MKRICHIFLLGTVAVSLAVAGIYPVVVSDWFSQTFSGMADGSDFTGSEGGGRACSWIGITNGVATVATVLGRKCIDIDTALAADDSIQIRSAAPSANAIERFDFAINTEPLPALPAIAAGDKGALLLNSNVNGQLIFAGYAKSGWVTNLRAPGFAQGHAVWLDCRAEFDYSTPAQPYVTYSVRFDGADYVPLSDEHGVSRFEAVQADRVRSIAFCGKFCVGDITCMGVDPDTGRVSTWSGDSAGKWDDPSKWVSGRVPGAGDLAVIPNAADIVYGKYTFHLSAASELSISNDCVRLGKGNAAISCDDDDYTSLGIVYVEPGVKLTVRGTYYGIRMGAHTTLSVDAKQQLRVVGLPLYLDSVTLEFASVSHDPEATALLVGPYGSGGVPQVAFGWTPAWHGRLDGSSTLWIVNDSFVALSVNWVDGARGSMVMTGNWKEKQLYPLRTASVGNGVAGLYAGGAFAFSRYLYVGLGAGLEGTVGVWGGRLDGADDGSAILVGSQKGRGALEIADGRLASEDYLWSHAVTVGVGTNAMGVVSVAGGVLDTKSGSLSVGEGGTAALAVTSGVVSVGNEMAVGSRGSLSVVGGVVNVGRSVYVGRSDRDDSYDVTMTVTGGAVSNLTEGAFWVGSYGGFGSSALLSLQAGEIYATNMFVCGGYRSARTEVSGGRLVAREIRVGHALSSPVEVASFLLEGGRVETCGFTAGSAGVREVVLTGGELVMMATNVNFFAGLDAVRLEGMPVVENASNVTMRAAVTGVGGFAKRGDGTLTVAGPSAWTGLVSVDEGVLDMDGGMILGELAVADGASVRNAKFDDIETLTFLTNAVWNGRSPSSGRYLEIVCGMTVGPTNRLHVLDSAGAVVGGLAFVDDGSALALACRSALGTVRLDSAGLVPDEPGAVCEVRLLFDFSGGKPYAFYYVKHDGGWTRLAAEDGLSAFPVLCPALSASGLGAVGAALQDPPGRQLDVDASRRFVWKSDVPAGRWNDAANWQGPSGYPSAADTAVIQSKASIDVSSNPHVATLLAESHVTLAGGSLTVNRAGGHGVLVLDGTSLFGASESSAVRVAVEVSPTEECLLGGDVGWLSFYGVVRGSGAVTAKARFYGDMSGYAGALTLIDGAVCTAKAARNVRAAWTVSGSPFAAGDGEYAFGAIDGLVSTDAADPKEITLVVGGDRDDNCDLAGRWAAGSHAGLVWAAPTRTMTYAVDNTSFIRVTGGGHVVVASPEAVPSAISFADAGGDVALATGVTYDLSGLFVGSTAPIGYDDRGVDATWAETLGASNVGGLLKRGAGTLTLKRVPAYGGTTFVEQGTLVVPYGTALSALEVGRHGRVVLDMADAPSAGVALAIARSNCELSSRYLGFTNTVLHTSPKLSIERLAGNGVVVYAGSRTFVWAGEAGSSWSVTNNWLVNGSVAAALPAAQDEVVFAGETDAVALPAEVSVRAVRSMGNLTLSGADARLDVTGPVEIEGRLTFADAITLRANDIALETLCGTGSVSVANRTLGITSQDEVGTDWFVGELDVDFFVKDGIGAFTYEPVGAFEGMMCVEEGTLLFDCRNDMTNHPAADVTMLAGATLDLCGTNVTVRSFTGAGTVGNGLLMTSDRVIVQRGGDLTVRAVPHVTYVLSHAGERLVVEGEPEDVAIVLPSDWYVAGASGRHAVYCRDPDVSWRPASERARIFRPTYDGEGWWSFAGGGFTVRLR